MTKLIIKVPLLDGQIYIFNIVSSDNIDTLIANVGDIDSLEDFYAGVEMELWSIA